MKQLLIFFLFISFSIQSQDYNEVDKKVRNYPKYTSANRLANKIKADFDNDGDKIRAVFVWLTENIKYDLKEYYNPKQKRYSFKYKNEADKQAKLQRIKDQLVDETFKSRKSVCEGYAQSFKKVCDLLNIESKIIKGYARNSTNDIGKSPKSSNHAWNAVKVGRQWKLVDATWAAGYAMNNRWTKFFNDYYFYPNPRDLLRSHFPEEDVWQMVKSPISGKAYANQPLIGQGFFSRKLELVSPKNGIITKKGNLEFKIKNLSQNDVVGYVFKGQQYGKKATITYTNNIGSFTINIPNKRNNELFIFINNEIALEYKIK
jgi:transglutaminase/protease-like cytokinesis protein 3